MRFNRSIRLIYPAVRLVLAAAGCTLLVSACSSLRGSSAGTAKLDPNLWDRGLYFFRAPPPAVTITIEGLAARSRADSVVRRPDGSLALIVKSPATPPLASPMLALAATSPAPVVADLPLVAASSPTPVAAVLPPVAGSSPEPVVANLPSVSVAAPTVAAEPLHVPIVDRAIVPAMVSDLDVVRQALERWRLAWVGGDLAGYIACYDRKLTGDARTRSAWEKDRREKLARGNIGVIVEDLKIDVAQGKAEVTFTQRYSSSSYMDVGIKQMRLRETGGTWLIVAEKWRGK